MKSTRRLALRKDLGFELTGRELRSVVGAIPPPTEGISCVHCPSVPLTNCPSIPLGDCTILDPDTVTCPTDVC